MSVEPQSDTDFWLATLGLGEYAASFSAHDIDLELVCTLTSDDLREVGVHSVGHRRRILDAAKALGKPRTSEDADVAFAGSAPGLAPVPDGERRIVTVMFCDLIDSTALSVHSDPEDYVAYINDFRRELEAAITPFDGHIAQFLGDGVMASFGYPTASGHDAEGAVAAGLAVIARVAKMRPLATYRPHVRVGIATGLTVVGAIDPNLSLVDRSAIGEIPNLAARLQTVAEPDTVVISPQTRELIGNLFLCADRGEFELKGIDGAVNVWQVLGSNSRTSRYEALRTEQGSTAFVGRVEELNQILEHLGAATHDGTRVVAVIGEVGIGKSRIARQALVTLGRPRDSTSDLQCSPYSVGVAFAPLNYMIRRAAGLDGSEPDDVVRRQIGDYLRGRGNFEADHVEELAVLIGGIETPSSTIERSSEERRLLAMSIFADVLIADSRTGRALVIEDAHWIDPSTAELLSTTLPRLGGPVVATMQPGPIPTWLDATDARIVRLGPLDADEVTALVASLAGERPVATEVVAAIAARSDGVPVFADELARGYFAMATDDSGGNLVDRVPMSLSESIIARLDQMVHGRRIASIASAIGREFPISVLIAVSDLPASVVHTGIGELVAADVLAPGISQFGDAIRFRHTLVRDAAYQLMVRRQRVALHLRIADTLRLRFPDIAESLPHVMAIHLGEAGRPKLASTEWERAAAGASSRSAYAEAAGYLQKSIEAHDATIEPGEQGDHEAHDERELSLRLRLMSALICSKGYRAPGVGEEAARIESLVTRTGSASGLIPVLHARWVVIGSENDSKGASELAARALALSSEASETDRLIALRMCATDFVFSGQMRLALDHYHGFLELYDASRHGAAMRSGHSDHALMVLLGLAEAYTMIGELDVADYWRKEVLDTSRASGRRHDQCHVLVYTAMHAYISDRLDSVDANVGRLRELLGEQTLPNWSAFVDLFAGVVAFDRGDDSAFGRATTGYLQAIESRAFGNWWHVLYAQACIRSERWEQAEAALRAASVVHQGGSTTFGSEIRRLEAAVCRHNGDISGARENLNAALTISEELGLALFAARAKADLTTLAD